MTIRQGGFRDYDYDRMIVRFTLVNGDIEVPCSVSTAAMDILENCMGANAPQREAQFMRLRLEIEAQAAAKIGRNEFEGTPRGVVLRSIDFSRQKR
jgi:hypothetical protein